jgi:hypothetical protein
MLMGWARIEIGREERRLSRFRVENRSQKIED